MSTTTRYEFTLPVKTTNSLNSSQGVTRAWIYMQARKRAEQRNLVALVLAKASKRLVWLLHHGGLTITLTRWAPSAGLDPDDNLPAALKWIKDGIADVLGLAKCGPNSDRTKLITWKYDQRRSKPRVYEVHVLIERRGEPCETI